MKNKLLSLFIICLFTLISNAQITSTGGSCDCEVALNPTFELTEFNADNCTATFVANPGNSICLDNYYLLYKWHSDTGDVIHTQNIPSVTFEDFGELTILKVEVEVRISQSGYTICDKVSDSVTYSDVVCSAISDGEITVSKRAYSINGSRLGDDELDPDTGIINDGGGEIYRNQVFEWRVTIENTFTSNYCMFYEDFYPSVVVDGIVCDFSIQSMTLDQPGLPSPIVAQLSDIINIPPGITTLSFITKASVDPGCANQIENGSCLRYTNRFEYTLLQGTCPDTVPFTGVSNGGTSAVSSSVCVRAGCPMGLTDGLCISPENMKAEDVLDIDMNGHIPFANIKKIEGDILYDGDLFNTPTVQLIGSIELAGFVANLGVPTTDGTVHLTVEHADPSSTATFDISNSNGYNPLSLSFEFNQDLLECTEVSIINFSVTTTSGTSNAFMDPGIFCVDYSDYYGSEYESAWIATVTGETCASIAEPLTLTALGPFQTQNPDSQYSWTKDGNTTIIGDEQVLSVVTSGMYKVNITDENGCNREAEVMIDTCVITCSCGDLNPEITLTVKNCGVYPEVSVQNCENLSFLQYYWTFSNGNTFYGQTPPAQYNSPNGGDLTAKLEVKYFIDGELCEKEYAKEVVFIPCRGPKKSKLSLYPNPTKNKVTVALEGEDLTDGTLEVVDIYGVKVLETVMSETKIDLNVSKLKIGVYFVRYIANDKNVTVKRLSISQ